MRRRCPGTVQPPQDPRSVGSYGWCPHKFFITSNLGHKEPSGKKAESGNIVHKALELLARKKLAHQNRERTFSDPEVEKEFDTATFTPELAIEAGWDHYTNPERTIHPWTKGDRKKCEQWTWDVLLFNDGMFSPVNRNVVMPEQYFEITLPHDWAKYEYSLPDGRRYEGQLILRGTMDLVTRVRPGLIEYIDWKTGKRRCWVKDKVKEYENIPPSLFFKCLNINTLLITPISRNSSGFAILYTFLVKNILVRFKKINKCKSISLWMK